MPRPVVWRCVQRESLQRWELEKDWARRGGFRLYVVLRNSGDVVASIEESRPPEHAVVEVVRRTWPHPTGSGSTRPEIIGRARRWAEKTAEQLAAATPSREAVTT